MRLDGFAETTTPKGEVLRYENPGLAVWLTYSGRDKGRAPWFDLRRGRVTVKNPDREILEKMRKVAEALGAQVQGDESESY